MNKTGPIIVIEDDIDDQEILDGVFSRLGCLNKIFYFRDGNEALAFLDRTDIHPFLILSDINMPLMNGFDLRKRIFTNERLQTKCIPYLFFTTTGTKQAVLEAYGISVQGFFHKPNTLIALENTITKIIEYWKECIAPNHYD